MFLVDRKMINPNYPFLSMAQLFLFKPFSYDMNKITRTPACVYKASYMMRIVSQRIIVIGKKYS